MITSWFENLMLLLCGMLGLPAAECVAACPATVVRGARAVSPEPARSSRVMKMQGAGPLRLSWFAALK